MLRGGLPLRTRTSETGHSSVVGLRCVGDAAPRHRHERHIAGRLDTYVVGLATWSAATSGRAWSAYINRPPTPLADAPRHSTPTRLHMPRRPPSGAGRPSAVLQADDQSLPDLGQLERRGKLVFVPFGGDPRNWIFRFAELGCPEFHLLDREIPPATEIRRESARIVNLRPGCGAAVTNKRSLENYLHPAAIVEVRGVEVQFSDDDDVADLVAEQLFLRHRQAGTWRELPTRARRRLRNRAKSWLSTDALGRMTVARFDERDPAGEIRGWLRQIAELAGIGP